MSPHSGAPLHRKRTPRLPFVHLVGLALFWFIAAPVFASTVRPLNLEEMTRKAGDIVVGRCVSVEKDSSRAAGPPVVKVTIRVDQKLKGNADKLLTFRMLAAPDPASSDLGTPGVPHFQRGEDVMLFLYPASRSGLTSPVGLGQGKFKRVKDKSGTEMMINEFGNRSLFKSLSPAAEKKLSHTHADKEKRAIPSLDLIEMVQELVR